MIFGDYFDKEINVNKCVMTLAEYLSLLNIVEQPFYNVFFQILFKHSYYYNY